ncbi:protein MpASLBD9 [Marchantia polymorpha subsp. ruderalis]|uniref:LOB domain-containing protein n=2 Tax=Marchantia polymorpha TaxID=3197 RepID=A0AAF6B5K4_MARPO|nr:hypothetical protein MARPO_0080s0037 [Marchantia polymorpha]BBN07288.1 hypothetical protein Mp_4g02620 [Marchantia polymorpha subsp. ruderalis]|eukprot:PTQ34416.1 hypothetical protein MARPO_0080s0037 [Marchantia polymorpha]
MVYNTMRHSSGASSRCASCKYLRKRCTDECVLAPYFPADQPLKFAIVHAHFDIVNVIELLHGIPESFRLSVVKDLVLQAIIKVANSRTRMMLRQVEGRPPYASRSDIRYVEQVSEILRGQEAYETDLWFMPLRYRRARQN